MIWNVPNTLTLARVVLAAGCFAALSFQAPWSALGLFVVATVTDFVDGYWARRFGQITQFGRIADPFADKLLICGVFIYLAAEPASPVRPWMVVVIVGRELLVTSLRALVEGGGGDFSAKLLGKWKMVLQCLAAILGLLWICVGATQPWLGQAAYAATLAAVVLTLASGVEYVLLAARSHGAKPAEQPGSAAPPSLSRNP